MGSVAYAAGKHNTNRDSELIAGHYGAADLPWRNLAHVEDINRAHKPDTKASDQSSHYQRCNTRSRDLDDDTDDEDSASGDDCCSSAEPVCQGSRDEGAEEGASRQDGNDQTLLPCVVRKSTRIDTMWDRMAIFHLELPHGEDRRYVARVIAEQHAREGCEGTHDIGLHIVS